MLDAARMLVKHGYELYATDGTSKYLTDNGVENTRVLWPSEEEGTAGNVPSALNLLHNHQIDMVVNIPKDLTTHELTNGYKIRRAAMLPSSRPSVRWDWMVLALSRGANINNLN